jgi:hypothetical protein
MIVMLGMPMLVVIVMMKARILSSNESAKIRDEAFGHEGDDGQRRQQHV